MVGADVVDALGGTDGVVEVHGAAAGDEEDVAGAPVAQLAEDVIGEFNHLLVSCVFRRERTTGTDGDDNRGWRGRLPMGIDEYPRLREALKMGLR